MDFRNRGHTDAGYLKEAAPAVYFPRVFRLLLCFFIAFAAPDLASSTAPADLAIGHFAPNPTTQAAIAAFERMQADIEREKRWRDPERFIQQLDALRSEDPQAFATLRARLRDWLDNADSADTVAG